MQMKIITLLRLTTHQFRPSKRGKHGKGTTQFPTDANGKEMESLSGDAIIVYKHTGSGNYELVYEFGSEVAALRDRP